MLFADGKAIALSTSCGVETTGDTEETSSKDNGNWKEFIATMLSWTASSDSNFSAIELDSETADLAYKELFAKLVAMDPIDVHFGELESRTNSNNDRPDTGWVEPSNGYEGKAIITGISMSAPLDGKATISLSLQGTGELKAVTV